MDSSRQVPPVECSIFTYNARDVVVVVVPPEDEPPSASTVLPLLYAPLRIPARRAEATRGTVRQPSAPIVDFAKADLLEDTDECPPTVGA